MQVLQICAALLSFISLLLHLISLGSNNWLEDKNSYSGLWYGCSPPVCFRIISGSSKFSPSFGTGGVVVFVGSFEATRAFMLLGMIAGAVSFFGLCFTFYKSRLGSVSLAMVSAYASIAAGICAMIAMSVFTAGTAVDGTVVWYGWSFGLGWASFPFFLITGGLAFAFQSMTTE
ncbi:epithelial membrane protein 2-like [Anolis carolinensis]|uniref:epithelial membrane protein 2-like n=1 Tax=Anolis carolinensis TaxID=28377 RepID=UPI002F2B2D60